jgi:hypothetical protein
MSDYRRCALGGGTYFFTVALHDRQGRLLVEHVDALREAVRRAGGQAVPDRCVGGVAGSPALRVDAARW